MVRVRARPPHQQHSPPAGEQPPRSVPRARPAARATRRGPDTVTGPRVWHQDIHNKMGMQRMRREEVEGAPVLVL